MGPRPAGKVRQSRRQMRLMSVEQAVDIVGKIGQWGGSEAIPVTAQHGIEQNIQRDRTIASPVTLPGPDQPTNAGVRVTSTIDPAMQPDTLGPMVRQAIQRLLPLDVVTQKGPQSQPFAWAGEHQMGEMIHAGSLPKAITV